MFDDAAEVESLVWEMRLAEYPRSANRATINSHFNGQAPYTSTQAQENNIAVNVNFNDAATLGHSARGQFYGAFNKPANFFKVNIDRGPPHKQGEYGVIITKEINKILKRSLPFFESQRSTWANVVLHGIGPNVWLDKDRWCCRAKGVEEILVPSNTYLDLNNLQMFAEYESFTAMELRRLTRNREAATKAGWDMELVDQLIEYVDKQVMEFGIPNSEIYSPEKQAERLKTNSGLYAADSLATIDTWAFYFWNDEGKQSGWNKRIVLDTSYQAGVGGAGYGSMNRRDIGSLKSKYETRGDFLFNPKKRKYADKHSEIIHFQFGDLSAVGPFRYHSVRSLGFLLYAPCFLLNRLRCHGYDSIFEQIQQYFRVKTYDDFQRALSIDLINRGFIDESVNFVKKEERWQIDLGLLQFGLEHLGSIIGQHASIYRPDQNYGSAEKEKTATQVMAEVNRAMALVGTAVAQAYTYEVFKYREICRRFARSNSQDIDVQNFRAACVKQGVPLYILNDITCWDVEAERVVGGGNRMLEMAIGDKLMGMYQLFSPEAQRAILKQVVLWTTEDARWSQELVPSDENRITNSKHDAQLMISTLMLGLPVQPTPQQNYIEVLETLLGETGMIIQRINSMKGGMPSMEEFTGLQNVSKHIGIYLALVARDKEAKEKVREYKDDLSKINNVLKGYGQRLQEAAKAAQQQNGGLDGKDKAKVAGMIMQAQTKAALARESHAQRTASRQVQGDLEMQRDAEKHAQEMQFEKQKAQLDIAKEVTKHKMKAFSE
jgi:hypothetical protein